MKKILLPAFVGLSLVLAACNSSSDKKTEAKDSEKKEKKEISNSKANAATDENMWNQAERDAFLENCTKGASSSMGEQGAKDYCSCMLDKVVEKYPSPQDALKLSGQDMVDMAQDCVGKQSQ